MTESGYDGNKRLHCGSVRLDREQPVYTPSSLFSWPDLQLPSLRTLRPPVPEPGLCELRGLNTTTSAPSPQGEGSELSSFPSRLQWGDQEKIEEPPRRGQGDRKGPPASSQPGKINVCPCCSYPFSAQHQQQSQIT